MYASPEISSSNFKKVRTKKSILSLGLAMPFYPSMHDENSIQNILKDVEENARTMLCKALDPGCTDEMFLRLKNVFSKLNYNSHCKSIAVLIRPKEEKVTYLNFSVKPVIYLNKQVSLLELTANTDRQPDFYYLVLEQSRAKLYEYYHNRLNQVYATKKEPGLNVKTNPETLFKQVLQTIERLNGHNEKPVFISGSPNLVELFCSSSLYPGIFFKLLDNAAPLDEEIIKPLVKEIISHWDYWQSKFLMDQIMIAQKANVLIAEIERVLQALRNAVDGLLLIDKHLKQQLYKTRRANALFNTTDELMNQIECFLKRGNRIEITEPGLLKEFGDIVLLQNKIAHFFTISKISSTEKYNKPDTF